MIYTAITRAKELAILVGDLNCFKNMCKQKRRLKVLSIFKLKSCPYCAEETSNSYACHECFKELKTLCNFKIGKTKDCFFLTAPFIYKDLVRDAILDFKFNEKIYFCKSFAAFMAACKLPKFDVLVAVPTYEKKRNSSKEIAIHLKKHIKIKFIKKAVIKIKKTKAQHNCDYFNRLTNLKGAFKINEKKAKLLVGKNILICDDIITTSTTVQEMANVLNKAGANKVGAVSFAVSEKLF